MLERWWQLISIPVLLAGAGSAPAQPRGAEALVELLHTGRAVEAEARLRAASARQPSAPVLRYLLGVSLFYQQRLEEADAEIVAATTARGDRPAWFHTLAQVRFERGKCAGAVEALDRALALADEPRFRLDRAVCLLNLGRFEAAESDLRRLLVSTPDQARPQLLLARLLRDTGRGAEAHAVAEHALATSPPAVEARVLLGLLALDEGRNAAAVNAFRSVLEEVPCHTGATYGLAQALAASGEKGAAAETLRYYAELAAREERIENQRQFLSLAPRDVGVRLSLARELLALGRFDEAATELAVLGRLAPDHPEVRALLAAAQAQGIPSTPAVTP